MLVTFIQDRAPACKIHLLTWQLSNRRVYDLIQNCNFQSGSTMGSGLVSSHDGHPAHQYNQVFDSVSIQGSHNKEDYSELCQFLLSKTAAISFLSCQIDFKKVSIPETLDKLRAL